MYIFEEEGNLVGPDLRVTKVSEECRIASCCGEGEAEGPIRASFRLNDGVAVIHPNDKSWGDGVELRFEAGGARVRAGDGDFEFVPQPKNFVREERWR
jgi:hypothetical protein